MPPLAQKLEPPAKPGVFVINVTERGASDNAQTRPAMPEPTTMMSSSCTLTVSTAAISNLATDREHPFDGGAGSFRYFRSDFNGWF